MKLTPYRTCRRQGGQDSAAVDSPADAPTCRPDDSDVNTTSTVAGFWTRVYGPSRNRAACSGRGEVPESGLVALAIVEDLDELEQVGTGGVAVLEPDAGVAADVGDLPLQGGPKVSIAASKQSPVEPNTRQTRGFGSRSETRRHGMYRRSNPASTVADTARVLIDAHTPAGGRPRRRNPEHCADVSTGAPGGAVPIRRPNRRCSR